MGNEQSQQQSQSRKEERSSKNSFSSMQTEEEDAYALESLSNISLKGHHMNMVFMIEDDTNLMNKYRISFHSLTENSSSKTAKKDFISFAKKFAPESGQTIADFEKNYRIDLPGEDAIRQSLQWMDKYNFFMELTQ